MGGGEDGRSLGGGRGDFYLHNTQCILSIVASEVKFQKLRLSKKHVRVLI